MIPHLTELSTQQIHDHLTEFSQRQLLQPVHRQVSFSIVETLLCYGLFYIFDPYKYGGANIDKVPLLLRSLLRL
jgi:putative restriction endonuclease